MKRPPDPPASSHPACLSSPGGCAWRTSRRSGGRPPPPHAPAPMRRAVGLRWGLRVRLPRGYGRAPVHPGSMCVHHLPSRRAALGPNSMRSWIGLLIFLLACAGPQTAERPQVTCDGYDRGPGSFCALNPEACPPEQSPSDREPSEDLDAAAGKRACLDACEAGDEALASFCRRLKSPRRKAICWGATKGTKTACIGMCHALYR